MSSVFTTSKKGAIPLRPISTEDFPGWRKSQSAAIRQWLDATGFEGKADSIALLPGGDGIESILFVGKHPLHIWSLGALPEKLPAGTYFIDCKLPKDVATALCIGWQLGSYRFERYRKSKRTLARLVPPANADMKQVESMAGAVMFARDLINTPTNDMNTQALAEEAQRMAKRYKAGVKTINGEALLKANYPLVYTVGKGSASAPCLVDITWGDAKHPKVTLVGKGVCFDSGGLDLKSSANMQMMKKDMAGAAIVLALGQLIMEHRLPVRLRMLLPIVENSVSGTAMRPLDVVASRKGLTVEIGNTDAEGRLILCDALTEADSEKPDLLVDFSTLTGAARVALGTELPAFFTNDDDLAQALSDVCKRTYDPLYRLPLWGEYRDMLDSKIADISNDPSSGYGGAITAALYLKEFVEKTKRWVHIDMMAWNLRARPGRPVGGEPQTLMTVYQLIKERYGRR